VLKSHPDRGRSVSCLSFSADGELAATGDTQGSVRVFKVATGERLRGDMPAHAKALGDLALTPDKKTLITADEDGEMKIWDLQKRESGEPFTAHRNGFMGIMVSPDGSKFATMSRDGQVRLWDTKTAKQSREWNLPVPVRGLAFVPGAKQILAAAADGSVFVLDMP
jgi:WD40 repeat protein